MYKILIITSGRYFIHMSMNGGYIKDVEFSSRQDAEDVIKALLQHFPDLIINDYEIVKVK